MFTKDEIKSMKEFQIGKIFKGVDCSVLDGKFYFYYDETNNSISFGLNKYKNGFNDDPFSDFVVGGVMAKDLKNLKLDSYKQQFGLSKNTEEIKSKSIFKGSFFDCLSSNKTTMYLDIIKENDLYFHFSDLNKLFFSVSDIVSLIRVQDVKDEYFDCIPGMINILYECIKLDLVKFLNAALKYDFPNVSQNDIKNFYREIQSILVNNFQVAQTNLKNLFSEISFKLHFAYLYSAINLVIQGVFTAEFDEGKMIDSFDTQYFHLLFLFNNSIHEFDSIDEIQERFEDNFNEESEIDYQFKDSKLSFMIQLSDVFSSIVGKAVIYTNSVSYEKMLDDLSLLNDVQKANLTKLNELLIKSIEFHPSMCQYVTPLSENIKLCRLLFGESSKENTAYSLYF